jgi:hypothetical protein
LLYIRASQPPGRGPVVGLASNILFSSAPQCPYSVWGLPNLLSAGCLWLFVWVKAVGCETHHFKAKNGWISIHSPIRHHGNVVNDAQGLQLYHTSGSVCRIMPWHAFLYWFQKLHFFGNIDIIPYILCDLICVLVVRVPGATRLRSSGSGTGSTQPRKDNWVAP